MLLTRKGLDMADIIQGPPLVMVAEKANLPHLVDYIHEALEKFDAPIHATAQLDVACEELFANVCMYAYADEDQPGEVRFSYTFDPDSNTISITMEDEGVFYDPVTKKDASTVDSFENVMDIPIGGLGILLVRKNTDSMYYERVNGTTNHLTFTKSW